LTLRRSRHVCASRAARAKRRRCRSTSARSSWIRRIPIIRR
jgi:hypothetical protein